MRRWPGRQGGGCGRSASRRGCARNLGWLAGYRFPEGDEEGQGQALLEAFRQPTGLRAGVAASGLDELTGLDLAYRMLWQRRLLFDTAYPLLPDAMAWTA